MARLEVPVLVVGAGPVGLSAALLLAQQGIPCRVVDRRDGPHRAPQAHVVNPRTLEIFRAAGVDMDRLRQLATSRADGGHVAWMTTLAGRELGRLPYERQGDDTLRDTPTPLLNLSQHLLEPVLLEHLARQPGVTVGYRQQWTALQEDADGVTSFVDDHDRGERIEVRSRYLLAADGAGSRVRRALDIAMSGPDRIQSFVMIHFEAGLRDLVRDRPAILYWTLDPEASGVFVAHDIDRTWVFMHPYDPETESAASYDERTCTAIVQRAIGTTDVRFAIRDISMWTMTCQIADHYRRGRSFLIGDSAHRFPPSGGLGMNTGIQDAHNLVWKLRGVFDGWAPPSLLDTYEHERRPVAQQNAEQSLANAMRMMEMLMALGIDPLDRAGSKVRMQEVLADPAGRARVGDAIALQQEHFDMFGLQLGFTYDAGALVPERTNAPVRVSTTRDFVPTTRPGARVPHAWVERAGVRVSLLDLLPYDRFTLLTGPKSEPWSAAIHNVATLPIQRVSMGREFNDPDADWAAVSELGSDGALLIRPDQHVAWRAQTLPTDPVATLAMVTETIVART